MTIVGVEETSYLCSQKEKTINNMKKIFLLAVLSTAISLNINATDVADPIDVELNDSSRVYDLDAVVIVAEPKENVRLRQQPLSSSLFSQNEMLSLGVRDLRELSQYAPSLTMPNYGSRYTSSFYVRGIGSRLGSSSVGMYVDGMPLLSGSQYNFHVYQTDRIDILRGPQATLYGINSEGGLVRMFSRNPMNYEGTDIRLGAGTHGYRIFEAATYQRLSDKFGLSVAGFYEGQNGFFRNLTTGERADKYDEAGGRLRLVYQPTDRLTFDLLGDYQFTKQNGFPYGRLTSRRGPAQSAATDQQGNYRRNMFSTALTVKYAAQGFDINSTTSYQHLHDNMLMDIDYTPRDFNLMRQRQNMNAVTEELTFKRNTEGRWQWTAGAFFSRKWLTNTAPVDFGRDFGTTISTPINTAMYNAILASMARSIAAGMIAGGMPEAAAMAAANRAAATAIERAGGVTMDPADLHVPGTFKLPETNFGIFHQSSLQLTDRLTATLGLRYDMSHVSIDYCTRADMALTAHVMGKDATNVLSSVLQDKGSDTFHQLLPKVGLTYKVDNEGSNIYAVFSKGYRAGGYNFQGFSDIFNTELMANSSKANTGSYDIPHTAADYDNIMQTISYKPETSWNYELGTHLNLANGALQLDFSTYYIQIRNQQLSVMAGNHGFGRTMVNAGKSYSCGLELALRGHAFDNHLSYGFGYGYTRAVFKEYDDEVDGVAVSYKDKYVPYIPQHTLSANADYRFDFQNCALSGLVLGVNASALGRTYWDVSNDYAQNLYITMGAHADFLFDDFQVSLWGRNLTNTKYNTFGFRYGQTATFFGQRANPTQAGIDLRFHF